MFWGVAVPDPEIHSCLPRLKGMFPVVRFTSTWPSLVPQDAHWHVPCSHPVARVWFGLSCRHARSCFGGWDPKMKWTPKHAHAYLDLRGWSRSFVSLLDTVACPSRRLLTCPILRSGGAGLFRTQLQVRAVEKYVFWVVAAQDPQMDSCTLNFRSCSRSFVSLLHTVACPSRCLMTCPIPLSTSHNLPIWVNYL